MNYKFISFWIVCLIAIVGFMGIINFLGDNSQGTNVSGIVYDGLGGPWTIAGNPYIVIGDVTIPDGQTLTIEPGVQVKFDGYYSIYVNGNLTTVGTEMNRINFTSNKTVPAIQDWDRIQVSSTGHAEIKYCDISYGYVGVRLESASNNIIEGNNLSNNYDSIYLLSSSNTIIKDNNIHSNSRYGISLSSSSNNNISNNNIYSSTVGIHLITSPNNNITNCNVTNNYQGIVLDKSSGNNLVQNTVASGGSYGIYIWYSPNTYLRDNNLSNNGYNFGVVGDTLSSYYQDIDLSNTITGKPIYYIISEIDLVFDGNSIDIGFLGLVSCEDITVKNINIANNIIGLLLAYTVNTTISNVSFGGNLNNGIDIRSSSNNHVRDSNFSLNSNIGISIYKSSNNIISTCNVYYNSNHGIRISGVPSNYNSVINNNVLNNGVGISLGTSNNRIYYNYIVNNTDQALDNTNNGNQWDNGYPLGGNYWSDYDGIDLNSTPNQDVPPPDEIGDTPYIIDSDSQDNYPLMEPFKNYINLKQGWNLISIPLIQTDQTLAKVLKMIDGYYDSVQWYNNSDINNPWRHYKIGKPFGNDLSVLNETIGFWIHITNPGDTIFLYNGTASTSNQTIPLHPGWNMVGYPSLTNRNRTVGLNNLEFGTDVDVIQWYDTATKNWHFIDQDDLFVPGRGYWVHSKVDTTWEVPV